MNISDIANLAKHVAAQARQFGFVVTIEQVSTQPPAMGQHVDVVSVREAREPAPIMRRCAGRNCDSIDGSEHSPECLADYEVSCRLRVSPADAHKPAHGGRNA